MAYRIVPMSPEYIASFRETSDEVFRETQMFAFSEAPSLEQVTDFVLGVIRDGDPQFIALDGGTVIGWCDVLRKQRPTMRHSGVLGVGVLSAYRGQGVGTKLIQTTLDSARAQGITRVELYVRADNIRAKRLYERVGFTVEGLLRHHMHVAGVYRDSYVMALLTS